MEIAHVDKLKRPIKIGDYVAYIENSGQYHYYNFGYVVRFTKAMVWISSNKNEKKGHSKCPTKIIVIGAQVDANHNDYPELYI